jgi:hypothetical protein
MPKVTRTQRSEDDLIEALSDNLSLLTDAIDRARTGDFKYIKTIKGILRILVHTSGTNRPLLIGMAKKYSVTPIVRTDGPRGISERTLDDFLEEIGFASGTENIILKNKDLIVKGSQQEGGAHEDWAIDKDYLFAKEGGLLIGGIPPLVRKFIGMANCIRVSGSNVLQEIITIRGTSK